MKKKSISLALLVVSISANAQFYTIENENVKKKVVENVQVEKAAENAKETKSTIEADSLMLDTIIPQKAEVCFDMPKHKEIAIEYDVPLFVSVKDSMMYELLGKRRSISLPLDFLKVTSEYGYRLDPITRCENRFHAGVDLRAKYAHVYAMFPGVIEKVERKTTGYGNNIIINHGNLRVRYAHLSMITVSEGLVVNAGTIVGISGRSGRATAEHLHLEISKWKPEGQGGSWQKIDPEPFLAYLNDYIVSLQQKMDALHFDVHPSLPLTINNLFKVMAKYDIKYPKIVAAQCIMESGWFSSNLATKWNNILGLFDSRKGDYYHFKNWMESVEAYGRLVQRKWNPRIDKDYYAFLKRIGYAENMDSYNAKVRAIAKTL